ncbi:TIGR00341 family protein [Clostridium thailandense]|uniref:TIGR00341 family protein n=1 Tax=Clostridium thailandense TaxID=2794346 RepID=UPI00398A3740
MTLSLPVISREKRRELHNTIKNEALGGITYYLLVVLAAVVATLGLLTNSTAVIIGAMLISPIMSPIIGMSFAVTLGDADLFRKAVKNIIFGALLAVIVSIFITILVPTRSLTDEILSRTKPTIIDLIIALASGAAGAFTMCHKKESSVIPGVAIATALMPPLCVVGTGLFQGEYRIAFGGFLLFLANLVAINLASALIFRVSGFTTRDEIYEQNEIAITTQDSRNRLVISIAAFIAISIPLSIIMYKTILQERTKKTIDTSLKATVSSLNGVDLVNYAYEFKDNKYFITTVVRSMDKLNSNDVSIAEHNLERVLEKPVEIKMKVILAQEIDALTKSAQSKNTDLDAEKDKIKENTIPSLNTDKIIEYNIRENLNIVKAKLIDYKFSYSSNSAVYSIEATVQGDTDSVNKILPSIESSLENKLNRKVNIKVSFEKNTDGKNKDEKSSIDNINESDIYKTNDKK